MPAESSPPIIAGLSEIASDYDGVICDVWGVLHNGRRMFAPAIDAVRRFRAGRGPVVLLSNAPRPPEGVTALFDKLGIPHDFYDGIVTSGGEAREDLIRRTAGGRRLKLFYLGPPRDHPLFEGLDVELTTAEDAEVVLCTGFYDDETETPDDYRGLLETFRRRNLTFLCANPDIVVQRGDKLIYCAGAIARFYETMGGDVVYYGKPYSPIFVAAVRELHKHRAVKRPLIIGDGLETDIVGANRMGIDALFIVGGIHSAVIGDPSGLARVLKESGARARASMPALSW
jgi:HAD superfamily hydrolase (TIGR01459 family)